MHYVSLIVEALRGRPRLVFWTAALTQGALWIVIPSMFYSAPPGDVPLVLAIGHEFLLGSYLGPPLAFWLGEIAFRIAGIFGVYLLAQACIVVTYWAVFTPRPRHRRHPPRRARRAADGGHRRLHGAERRFRPGRAGGAVLGAGADALLARPRRGKARRLVPAGARSRPAAADELCRADPDRAAGAVHRRDVAGPPRAHTCRAVGLRGAAGDRGLSARLVAGAPERSGASPAGRRARRWSAGCRPGPGWRRSRGEPSRPGAADPARRPAGRAGGANARARRRSTAHRPRPSAALTSMCSRWRRR